MQASADRPRFRQDLVAEPIEDGGSKFIDVMDPDSGTLFRFFEVEYSLACAMDGQRDVAGIVRWAEEELGLKPSANEVKTVIATLGDLGYLESGATAAAAASAAASAPATTPAPTPAAAKPAEKPAAAATKPARPATPAGGVKKQPEAGGQPASNRWDAPTAMGDADEYLQPGVVTGGAKSQGPSAGDVELGASGARGAAAKGEDLPRGEFELGAPGATSGAGAAAARGASKGGENIALGASGASGVSVDLADHVDIGKNDVKEAVRASQQMKAVDVPPELAAELESKPSKPAEKPAAKAADKPAAKADAKATQKPAAKETKPAEKPAAKETKPAEKPAAKETKPAEKPTKPAEKPAEKRPETSRPIAPPARSGASPVLIGLLVLAILGAGGFAVYKYVLKKDTSTESTKVTPPPTKPPEPPPPPPVESQKLAVEQPAAEELKPTSAGQLAMVVANDTMVKAGDPVARLVGFKSLEADVAATQKALDKAKADVAAAGTDEKKLAAAQKAQADDEKKLADKQAALDKFLIKAPAAGKVTAVAKANAKITPTDIIATLTRDPVLVATFAKADGATQDAAVILAVKGSDQKLSCTVAQASPEGTKIACPKDAASEGAEVTYVGVDTTHAATPDNGSGNGSGTTPTGDTGSGATGSAAAGSAATGNGSAANDTGSASTGTGSAAGSAAVAPKTPTPRPRPRPRPHPPTPTGGDTTTPPAGGDTTAPAPAPTPAPAAGSAS